MLSVDPRRLSLIACGFLVACGHSGARAGDAGSRDAEPTLDAFADDADTRVDARSEGGTRDGTVDASVSVDSGDEGHGGGALPATFFSMTINEQGSSHLPTVPFGGLRLWDTTAVWPLLNTASGVYDFTELDAWLAEAEAAGVDVIFTFGRTPAWASSRPTESCSYGMGCAAPPSDIASGDTILKSFTTALVNHSVASTTSQIKYYEIWNEPDLSGTWSGTAAELVTIGQDITAIVHALDKSALVVGPSPSTGNAYGIHFLPAYYAAGGAPYQDVVGMHGYLYDGSTFATVPEGIVETITQLRLLMSANGVGDLPIFFTEGDWGGAPNDSAMTDDEKVAYLARDYLLMWMNGVARFYWYAWDNSGWGTLFQGGTTEPAGTAYGILESWLVGSTHVSDNCSQDASSTWTCALVLSSGVQSLIVWNPSATTSVSVPAGYGHYLTLDDTTSHAVAGGAVSASAKPILVTR
jgi:hypothetical protein